MRGLRRNMTVDGIESARRLGYGDTQIVCAFPSGVVSANMVSLVEDYGLSADAVISQCDSESVVRNIDWVVQQDVSPGAILSHLRPRNIDLLFDQLSKVVNVNLLVQHMTADGVADHLYQLLAHDDLTVPVMLDKAGSTIERRAKLSVNDPEYIDLPLAVRAKYWINFGDSLAALAREARELGRQQCHPRRLSEIAAEATSAADALLRRGGIDLLARRAYLVGLADCGAVLDRDVLDALASREVNNVDASPTGFIYGIEPLVRLGAKVDFQSWMKRVGAGRFATVARELEDLGVTRLAMLQLCQTAKDVEHVLFSLYGSGRSAEADSDCSVMSDIVSILVHREISVNGDVLARLMPVMTARFCRLLQTNGVVVDLRKVASYLRADEFIANFALFAEQGWHVSASGELVDCNNEPIFVNEQESE